MAPRRLRPREAAAWLAEHGCPGTVSTLEDVADLELFAAGQRVETVDSFDVGTRKASAAGRP